MNARIAVPGATGRTGRFVLAELERRGLTPIPCGRTTHLDLAFGRADAVVNRAGPFAETAEPVLATASGQDIYAPGSFLGGLDLAFTEGPAGQPAQ